MNAYELADLIQENYASANNDVDKVATMLRQQADRIAELEKELDRCKQSEKEGWRYSNELEAERKRLSEQCDAVYWVDDLSNSEAVSNQLKQELQLKHFTIPLYTTPQTKPLTDEEIIKIFNQIWNAGGNTNGVMHRFARAIEERHGIK